MKNFDAAIFDMDGTIADSLYVWKKVDIDFFGKRGKTLPSPQPLNPKKMMGAASGPSSGKKTRIKRSTPYFSLVQALPHTAMYSWTAKNLKPCL